MRGADLLRRILPTPRERRAAKPLSLVWIDVFRPDNRRAVSIVAPWVWGSFEPRPVANPRR